MVVGKEKVNVNIKLDNERHGQVELLAIFFSNH